MGLVSGQPQLPNHPINGNTPISQLNEADRETYLQFLLAVLKATTESKGNPQVVYPLLAANIDKLNGTFAQLLRAWATKTLWATMRTRFSRSSGGMRNPSVT